MGNYDVLENGNNIFTKQFKQFEYVPQSDITIYELARLLPAFFLTGDVSNFVENLPDEVRRHFKELPI